MENKKQLIIIPPMSEALKKLHEVLEGIAADENMEISLIDDLKELTQFLGTTGQCLVLASNAKKCATFLQENRFVLAKHHCKTILFTPKEIPAKTLIKFTKIGLTESILENSPPKTFLYKVKLLLRSIKTAKPAEDAEKTVKSLEHKVQIEQELELKERDKNAVEENVIDMERQKKEKEEGETIDYGNPLKGKIKPTEENIDTHWKSERKKTVEINFEEGNSEKKLESDQTDIDMYYRGKNKNLNTITPEEEDDFDKKMAELMALEEAAKKKSSYVDDLDEGTMKAKSLKIQDEYVEEEKTKKESLDLDIEAANKPKAKENLPDEEDEFDKKMAELMALEAEAKKKKGISNEDLGGYLKGKLAALEAEELDEVTKEKKDYDNSELEEEEKSKSIELDLQAGDKKKEKQNDDLSDEDNVHEGEVDHLEGNMIGDEGTVDKIRTRMEGRSSTDKNSLDDEDNDSFNREKKKKLEEEETTKDRNGLEIDPEADDEERQKRVALRSDAEEKEIRQKSTDLEMDEASKKERSKTNTEEEEDERERKALDPLLKGDERERGPREKNEDDDDENNRTREKSKLLEKVRENNVHNSTVDKIDTFYRSGDASKKKDQNWDNLVDKKSSLELLPGKERSADGDTIKATKTDLGEQTIDYRKMKEEFDMIAGGASADEASGGRSAKGNKQSEDDDGDSFRVVEIDPKALDFSINIISSIYQKDIKPKQIFEMLAAELIASYHCYPVFYTYKLSDKKFTETFNSFVDIKGDSVSLEKKEFWNEFKKETALFEHFQEKSMTTWRCPEVINNNEVWEDVELPSWADNELKNKKVELIFPYFDGIDRMGMAIVLLPDGLDPKAANGLLTVLEMARTLFLDTIQRYKVEPIREDREDLTPGPVVEEEKNAVSFFGGLFGKKKTG